MTRMADDFERADHERDLRKADWGGPVETEAGIRSKSLCNSGPAHQSTGGNDLLLVALIVFGLLISGLTVIITLINHAAHQPSHTGISFRIAIPHCHFVDSRQAADCTIKKLNDAANQ